MFQRRRLLGPPRLPWNTSRDDDDDGIAVENDGDNGHCLWLQSTESWHGNRRIFRAPKSILKPNTCERTTLTTPCSETEANRRSLLHGPAGQKTKMVVLSHSQRHIRHCVVFKSVHVRDYARTVGDNPSVSSGPPLA
jgi:hypothetical protein